MKILNAGIAATMLFVSPACITVKPSDEPIHIVVDVNLKVQIDRELDKFFDFDDAAPAATTAAEPETEEISS